MIWLGVSGMKCQQAEVAGSHTPAFQWRFLQGNIPYALSTPTAQDPRSDLLLLLLAWKAVTVTVNCTMVCCFHSEEVE